MIHGGFSMSSFDFMFDVFPLIFILFGIGFTITFVFVMMTIIKGTKYQRDMMDHHYEQINPAQPPRQTKKKNRVCQYCKTSTNDPSANHCVHCGARLDPLE